MQRASLQAGALAVDREKFSSYITTEIRGNKLIDIRSEEVMNFSGFDNETTIIASGPLTSDSLSRGNQELTGEGRLHFFDAAAPIVTADSIDMEHAFLPRVTAGETIILIAR